MPAVFVGGEKDKNVYLSRKPQSKRKAVVLVCSGLYCDLRRHHHFGDRVREPLERAASRRNSVLCFFKSADRRSIGHGLYH